MSTKEKQKQKLPETPESKKSLSMLEKTSKEKLNGELLEDPEELIKRIDVENTPFVIINIENEYFGTFGQYRITEVYETEAQCKRAVSEITWNNIIKIMTLITEMVK